MQTGANPAQGEQAGEYKRARLWQRGFACHKLKHSPFQGSAALAAVRMGRGRKRR
ncbi:hypothetical protein C4K39_3785 [Pseudomonas sessilinigenes]|nr:hypothetical protein C4K39_3785 [Pseudomonas sessilinigenes]